MLSREQIPASLRKSHQIVLLRAERFVSNPIVNDLVSEVSRAFDATSGELDANRPLTVALIGGTGVGKSTLFNALIDLPDASATSSTRSFTSIPHVAVAPEFESGTEWLRAQGAKFVPPPPIMLRKRIALVDTPDVDGDNSAHRETARNVVRLCDVVVYVVSPEKYSNLATLQELVRWGPSKTWLFVLNKADQPDGDLVAVSEGFRQRLVELGFQTPVGSTFAVTARDSTLFDLPRLKETLFTQLQTVDFEEIRLLNRLGLIAQALSENRLNAMDGISTRFNQRVQDIESEIDQAFLFQLRNARVKRAFLRLVTEQTWSTLAARFRGPVNAVLWIVAKLSTMGTMLTFGRAFSSNLGALGLLTIGLGWIAEAVRPRIQLVQVARLFDSRYRRTVEGIARRVKWAAEDAGLPVSEQCVLNAPLPDEELPSVFKSVQGLTNRVLNGLGMSESKEVIEQLERVLTRTVEDVCEFWDHWSIAFAVNILPLIVFSDICRRLLVAWQREVYFEFPFYVMAFGLFVLSCFVSCLPVWYLANRRIKSVRLESSVDWDEHLSTLEPFKAVSAEFTEMIEQYRVFRADVAAAQKTQINKAPAYLRSNAIVETPLEVKSFQ